MTDSGRERNSGRERLLHSVGHWLLSLDFKAPGLTGKAAARALGAAWFAVRMKGIEGVPEGEIWSGAKRGSLGWKWGHAHSSAKHSLLDNPGLTWGQMLRHELNAAAAEPEAKTVMVLEHDRRKDGQPLIDPDLPVALEPVPRKSRDGRPLGGPDPLIVIHGLAERGFEFPPGLLADGELEQVRCFLTRSDEELQAEWGVKPAALRKRRERLRRRMSQLTYYLEGGFVDAPTIASRLARVEEQVRRHDERVREHDRQLGLIPDDEVEAAVEFFLNDLADEQGGGED